MFNASSFNEVFKQSYHNRIDDELYPSSINQSQKTENALQKQLAALEAYNSSLEKKKQKAEIYCSFKVTAICLTSLVSTIIAISTIIFNSFTSFKA